MPAQQYTAHGIDIHEGIISSPNGFHASTLVVWMRIIHVEVFSIPVHTGLATGFLLAIEGRNDRTVSQQLVDIYQTAST